MFNYIKCKIKNTNSQNKEVLSKKEYEFINFLEDIDVGDWIITQCTNGYQIGKVTQTHTDGIDATAYVLSKINNTMIPRWTKFHNEYKDITDKFNKLIEENKTSVYVALARISDEARDLLVKLNKFIDQWRNDDGINIK